MRASLCLFPFPVTSVLLIVCFPTPKKALVSMPSLRELLRLKRRSKKLPDKPPGQESPAEPSQLTSAQETPLPQENSLPQGVSLPQEVSHLQEVSLPRVQLDAFPSHKDLQSVEVTKRRDELREALEEIEGVLQAHSQKASTRSPAVKACIENADKTISSHGLVTALQDDQETRSQSASSKAGR